MKKIYTLLFSFLWLLGFSQNVSLTNKHWQIEKVIMNNTTILPPNEDISYFIKFYTTNVFSYFSEICSGNFGDINYSNSSNDFTITNIRSSLGDCSSSEITNFNTNYSLFFTKNSSVTNKINYNIEANPTGYKLTLENATGDQVIYNFHTPSDDLTSQIWKIKSVNVNGISYNTPAQWSSGSTTFDFNNVQTSYFNSGFGNIGYCADNKFRLLSLSTTLADPDDIQISLFEAYYFGFLSFVDKKPYSYNISNDLQSLTITKYNGDFAIYSNKFLNINESSKSKISVYPNPATDIVIIENLKPNSSLELIDNSGKLIRSISNIKTTKTEINIKNLASGIYYLKVDGQSVQKIIKK